MKPDGDIVRGRAERRLEEARAERDELRSRIARLEEEIAVLEALLRPAPARRRVSDEEAARRCEAIENILRTSPEPELKSSVIVDRLRQVPGFEDAEPRHVGDTLRKSKDRFRKGERRGYWSLVGTPQE